MIDDSWLILLFVPLLIRYILQFSPNLSLVCFSTTNPSIPEISWPFLSKAFADPAVDHESWLKFWGLPGMVIPLKVILLSQPPLRDTWRGGCNDSVSTFCVHDRKSNMNEWWDLQFTHMIWYWLSCINTDQSGYIRSSSWLLIITHWLRGEHICHDSRFRWPNALSAKEVLGFAGDPKGVTGDGASPQRQLGRGVMLSEHATKFAGPDFLSKMKLFSGHRFRSGLTSRRSRWALVGVVQRMINKNPSQPILQDYCLETTV